MFTRHLPRLHAAKCVSKRRVWVTSGGCWPGWYWPCVVCVCVYVQLPADFSRLHLADGLHPQVTHVSSSHSGCSITSDSGSSSLSDIYQVRPPSLPASCSDSPGQMSRCCSLFTNSWCMMSWSGSWWKKTDLQSLFCSRLHERIDAADVWKANMELVIFV